MLRMDWPSVGLTCVRQMLFALNRLDAVEDMLKEQLRLVKFPKTLDGDFVSAPKVVKRVRHKGGAK